MVDSFFKASCGTDVLISSEDLNLIHGKKWHITTRGYVRTQIKVNGKQSTIMLHRLISKANPGQIVDHINRVKTDNRKSNLRIASSVLNCINRNPIKNKASKYKGVSKNKSKWQVYVKRKYVGLFDTEEQAAFAYDECALSTYGDDALTNRKLGLL